MVLLPSEYCLLSYTLLLKIFLTTLHVRQLEQRIQYGASLFSFVLLPCHVLSSLQSPPLFSSDLFPLPPFFPVLFPSLLICSLHLLILVFFYSLLSFLYHHRPLHALHVVSFLFSVLLFLYAHFYLSKILYCNLFLFMNCFFPKLFSCQQSSQRQELSTSRGQTFLI